ncbi:galactose-1-epimerase, partial [Paraburkholderia aspalathi]|nr:galactose-1-epimerase [Paraburkholderia aspalathi]
MLAPYLEKRRFYGATIGRFANRIGTSRFILEGAEYQIEANEGANSLHGGFGGFDRVNWSVSEWQDGENPSVTLIHTSPDGAGGYPG